MVGRLAINAAEWIDGFICSGNVPLSSADTALTSQDRSRESHPRGEDGGSGRLHRGTDTDGAGEKDTERERQRETETEGSVTASVGWRGTALETEVPVTRRSAGRVQQGVVFAL